MLPLVESKTIRSKLRRLCGVSGSRCPIFVTPGIGYPVYGGQPGFNQFPNGYLVRSPGGAIRAGLPVIYVRSEMNIIVGDEWLAVEWGHSAPLAQRLGLREDTDLGILADYAEEHGLEARIDFLRASLRLASEGKPHGVYECRLLLSAPSRQAVSC